MTAPTFEPGNPATAGVDDEFNLDIRIAVGADMALPEAGFSCSWFTCNPAACAEPTAHFTCTGSRKLPC
jgi:hypothetical protein